VIKHVLFNNMGVVLHYFLMAHLKRYLWRDFAVWLFCTDFN